jgi:hypothetical protein
MMHRLRKLILCLMLASLPLQSLAGPAHLYFCDDAQQSWAVGTHDHDSAHHSHDGADAKGDHTAHDCYHNYFSGVIPGAAQQPGLTGASFALAPPDDFRSFFPSRLKRPPLALAA